MVKIKRIYVGILAITSMTAALLTNILWLFFICWACIGVLITNDFLPFFDKEEFLIR